MPDVYGDGDLGNVYDRQRQYKVEHWDDTAFRDDIGQSRDRIDLKERIQANITDSQKARESSRFDDFSKNSQFIELNAKAEKYLFDEIGKISSRSQAEKIAAMIGAYDIKTGKIAVGRSNAQITADTLDPRTVGYIENQLGVKIGEFTSFCKNKVGACAEVSAADQLIRQGADPKDIHFTKAVVPRQVKIHGFLFNERTIKETCENCQVTWPRGTK